MTGTRGFQQSNPVSVLPVVVRHVGARFDGADRLGLLMRQVAQAAHDLRNHIVRLGKLTIQRV